MPFFAPRTGRAFPWSERVVTAFVAAFALWTLCSHVVVALGGSFWQLLALAAAVLGAAAVVWWRGSGLHSNRSLQASPSSRPASGGGSSRSPALRLGILGFAALAVPLLRSNTVALWWMISLCLIAGLATSLREPRQTRRQTAVRRRDEVVLWILAFLCAGYALLVHRPDADDAFYVNVAASAVDRPDQPVLTHDTLHGLDDAEMHLTVYRFHSWELWNAAVALLLGISALGTFHLLSAPFVAFLLPMAWAVLLRRLLPRTWLPTLVALLVVLAVPADVHRWYGNFAFVRIWQGKSLFISVLLPVLWAWGLRFADRPSLRSGSWTLSAVLASVGATSTALWAAPFALATAVLAGLRRRHAATVALGAAVLSGYVLVLGWSVKDRLSRFALRAAASAGETGSLLAEAIDHTLGDGPLSMVGLVAIAAAWTVAPSGDARRFAAVGAFVPWILLLNPYLGSLIASQVSGPSFWRVFWVLPTTLLMAILLASPWQFSHRRGLDQLFPCLLCLFLFAMLPRVYGWSEDNQGARLQFPPGYKVPTYELARAGLLHRHAPPGALVVVPPEVAIWVSTYQGSPNPVAVRGYLPIRGYERRDRMNTRAVAGGRWRHAESVRHFRTALWRYGVEAVLFDTEPRGELMRQTLRQAAFEPVAQRPGWEIWVRRGLDPEADPSPHRPIGWGRQK